MRSGGHVHSSRSRSKDQDSIAPTTPASLHGPPTSFFLATEDMISKSRNESDARGLDSTYGVKSLQETGADATEEQVEVEANRENLEEDHGRRKSTFRVAPASREQSHEDSLQRKGPDNGSPLFDLPPLSSTLPSVSSLSQDSRGAHPSLPSSPKSSSSRSCRPSDLDSTYDGASQAIASSEDEADAVQALQVPDSAPQLVMPSIQMPSRRPFTERGKSMGRLKILVAGDSGMFSDRVAPLHSLTIFRAGQNIAHQILRTALRGHHSCGPCPLEYLFGGSAGKEPGERPAAKRDESCNHLARERGLG